MSGSFFDRLLEHAGAAVLEHFIGGSDAGTPAPAAPEPAREAPIEVTATGPHVVGAALGPQRFTCPCGRCYEAGIDLEPHPDGRVVKIFYVKPVGPPPAVTVKVRRRKAARR